MYSHQEMKQTLDVAMGRKKPDSVIKNGEVLNVYTGRLLQQDIVISGKRVVFVGNIEESGCVIDDEVHIYDVKGKVVVPGYIEPHAHPFQLYQPISLAEKVLKTGTTTLINDNLFFFGLCENKDAFELLDELKQLPVKQFWWTRFDPQCHQPHQKEVFTDERISEWLSHAAVVQAGELTDWLPILQGDSEMNRWMHQAKQLGKRIEAHAPGASYRTLSRLAVAGVTGDHESITVDEVWKRLELGLMTTLRHSSIRPDLPELIQELVTKKEVPWHRLMMTTDGATPPYLEKGFIDYVLRVAIDNGVNPIHAYQMVTINPAQYYRIDDHVGAIAPGKIADFNILEDLHQPTPVTVFADGVKVVEQQTLIQSFPKLNWINKEEIKWNLMGQVTEQDLRITSEKELEYPVIQLVNAVITKCKHEWLHFNHGFLSHTNHPDLLHVYLIDKHGQWIIRGLIRGFGEKIDALASSYTSTNDLLVIGRDPQAMMEAINHIKSVNGGITWIQQGEMKYHLHLPLLGTMSFQSVDELIISTKQFSQKLAGYGYHHIDPIYTLLFLSSTHLPQIRLTSEGLMRVKDKHILTSSARI
ncbi:adenine deaminase [Hazenella sp. IB182357]|uniref:adenine deaminase n=1 Tax=Polycladospora coralii TaxID=2771432 RepID=A0A926RUT0_9BACL|nr:adenine deaminase C-terminal domain-containing protein [Polycladospora coralii]MBD1373363.1 adenine deaminase [Polycladospora coralii]